jgi:hypothetical protein
MTKRASGKPTALMLDSQETVPLGAGKEIGNGPF